ncbi:MAG: hypothetical protein DRR19_15485 [Candidatus Parabeggiatoa sp. nov. 1]|nr:MAG: hypothetical protein DRR19_15485 [Gammaproteobacteria bacterium]
MPIDTSLVKAFTQFIDCLHNHYSGLKIRPISNYKDEYLAFQIVILRKLSVEQILETCHKECIKAEEEYD